MVGASKIRLTSLNTSDTNSFRDAFNDEITFITSFIPTFFRQQLVGHRFLVFAFTL